MRIQLYHYVVIGVIVVFLCNMAISYYHAWEMYGSIGDFPGFLAHVAVVAFDTVFALATLVISIGTLKKIDLGARVWVAFVFGFVITTWSNIRASMGSEWIYFVTLQWGKISPTGWESLAAGLSTPAALVAIELLLSWMVTHREKFTSTREAGEDGDTRKTGGEITTTNNTTSDATSTSNNTPAGGTNTTITTSTSKAGEAGDAEKTEVTSAGDNTTTSSISTTNSGDTTSTNATSSTSDKGTSETGEAGDTTSKTGDTNSTSSTTTSTTNSTSETGGATTDKATTSTSTTRKTGATKKAGGEKKKRHLRLVKNDDPELERVKKVALDHFKEHGEWPGRPTLMEKADCRENVARRALRDLREEQEKVERGA